MPELTKQPRKPNLKTQRRVTRLLRLMGKYPLTADVIAMARKDPLFHKKSGKPIGERAIVQQLLPLAKREWARYVSRPTAELFEDITLQVQDTINRAKEDGKLAVAMKGHELQLRAFGPFGAEAAEHQTRERAIESLEALFGLATPVAAKVISTQQGGREAPSLPSCEDVEPAKPKDRGGAKDPEGGVLLIHGAKDSTADTRERLANFP